MLDTASVTAKFLVISGLDEADGLIETVCACSALRIGEMLKDGVSAEDERAVYAAACDAYYQWILIGCAADDEAFESMKAGDITVTADNARTVASAKQLRDASLEGIKMLITDNAFYFSEVDINDA